MRLSTDALEGKLKAFLICFRDMITRDNKVARRVFDAFKVPKITRVVCPPNVGDRSRFADLSLCVTDFAEWILGYRHRHISKTFYNLFAACDGPPVGNAVLVELLFVFVPKLKAVASFSEFEEANKSPNDGTNILNARALIDIYHWREVHAADFAEEAYHKPC